MLEPMAQVERAGGTHKDRDEPLEVDRQLVHRPTRPSARSARSICTRGARVSSSSRNRGVSRRWPVRGEDGEVAKGRRWGGRGRTCCPAAVEHSRPAPSASCTFLDLDERRAPVREAPSVSREVGRRGSLMRTRRRGSGPWARADGGAGGAQMHWRVVQVARRGPSRVPSREGEWTRSEEEHKPGGLTFCNRH